MLVLSFPHNPTTICVDRTFFERVVEFAREHRLMVVHDFAYADFAYDGYRPPSFLQVPGAKEVGVEIFSTSKSYNMPGWRLGFLCGNTRMIHALARIKSYLDYGAFQPIQIAGIIALEGDQSVVSDIVEVHRKRRDVLVNGLNKIGWKVEKPKGTMFVWAPIPEQYRTLGSLEFSKLCIEAAEVAVSPGIGFGEYGEGFDRSALAVTEQRLRQALRGLKPRAGGGPRAQARRHGEQGPPRASRAGALRRSAPPRRHAGVRGGRRGGHPVDPRRQGRARRQPHPLRVRHRQRDVQLHPHEDDRRGPRLR